MKNTKPLSILLGLPAALLIVAFVWGWNSIQLCGGCTQDSPNAAFSLHISGPTQPTAGGDYWVTMTDKGPVVCNLLLDGILDEDAKRNMPGEPALDK